MRVLVVEDERPLAAALRRTLEADGFSACWPRMGSTATGQLGT